MKTLRMVLGICLVTGMVLLCSAANAGQIYLMEGWDCTEDIVDHASDDTYKIQSYNGSWWNPDDRNDEIVSLNLQRVFQGTAIWLYDAKNWGSDDMITIEVKKYIQSLCINLEPVHVSGSIGEQIVILGDEDSSVKVTMWYNSDGRVAGKVSSWKIWPGMSMPGSIRNIIDQMHMNIEAWNNGFPIEGNRYEYSASDHQFRMHRPAISPAYLITFKLDHKRSSAFDDWASVTINTDPSGKPVGEAKVEIKLGTDDVFQILTDITNEVIDQLPEDLKNNKYVIIASVATKVADKVYEQVLKWTDFGGRDEFKNQIEHKTHEVLWAISSVIY